MNLQRGLALQAADSETALAAKLYLQNCLVTRALSPTKVEGILVTIYESERWRKHNGNGQVHH